MPSIETVGPRDETTRAVRRLMAAACGEYMVAWSLEPVPSSLTRSLFFLFF